MGFLLAPSTTTLMSLRETPNNPNSPQRGRLAKLDTGALGAHSDQIRPARGVRRRKLLAPRPPVPVEALAAEDDAVATIPLVDAVDGIHQRLTASLIIGFEEFALGGAGRRELEQHDSSTFEPKTAPKDAAKRTDGLADAHPAILSGRREPHSCRPGILRLALIERIGLDEDGHSRRRAILGPEFFRGPRGVLNDRARQHPELLYRPTKASRDNDLLPWRGDLL